MFIIHIYNKTIVCYIRWVNSSFTPPRNFSFCRLTSDICYKMPIIFSIWTKIDSCCFYKVITNKYCMITRRRIRNHTYRLKSRIK